jgi:hypothetical protein
MPVAALLSDKNAPPSYVDAVESFWLGAHVVQPGCLSGLGWFSDAAG